jgi:hypothetical protein
LLSMFLVEIFLSLVSWFLASPWVCLTWFFYILATKCVMSPLDILRTCSKYVNHISPPFDTLILVNTWDNIIKIALLFDHLHSCSIGVWMTLTPLHVMMAIIMLLYILVHT